MTMTSPSFLVCDMCGSTWQTRDDFLDDMDIHFIGLQPAATPDKYGLFLFSHLQPDCGTTMSLGVSDLENSVPEPRRRSANRYAERPWFCLWPASMPCPPTCTCESSQIIVDALKKRMRRYRPRAESDPDTNTA
jgi:hypothetical protein